MNICSNNSAENRQSDSETYCDVALTRQNILTFVLVVLFMVDFAGADV